MSEYQYKEQQIPSLNKVILMGNLTRDPALNNTHSGTAVTSLSLAVNRSWFDKQTNQRKEEVDFIEVTLWGRTAEIACQYLAKGRPVLIEGRLQLDSWEDKETHEKRYKLKVVGENLQLLGGKGDRQQPEQTQQPQDFGELPDVFS